MTAVSRPRRLLLAAAALGGALALLHGPLASALVARGDDVLRSGDATAAIRIYARAVRLDGRAAAAADRLAFALLMRRERGDVQRASSVADAALAVLPHDASLLADRAFAETTLHRWRRAASDFTAAARAAHDARYAHLAARAAEAGGDRASALSALRLALAIDPSFAPSRALAARLRR